MPSLGKFASWLPLPVFRLITLAILVLPSSPAASEPVALMDAQSLQGSRQETESLQRMLKDALRAAVEGDVLDGGDIARLASRHAATRVLLDRGEAAFQRGRGLHVELDLPGAIGAYRDSILAYRQAGSGVYQPAPLAEAHLQLAAALSESNRLPDAMTEMKMVVLLTPWRTLDPSIYNPSICRLFDRKRSETEKLPDLPADETTLVSLGRLSGAARLVRPLVEVNPGGLVVRAVVIDLERGRMIGVESVLVQRNLQDVRPRLDELIRKLGPALGIRATPPKPVAPVESPPDRPPVKPDGKKPGPALELAAGFSAGLGAYPSFGARVLKAHIGIPLHERIVLSIGTGARLDFTGRVQVEDSRPDGPTAKLFLLHFPLEVCAQVVILPGDFQLYVELGAFFELLSLTGKEAQLSKATPIRLDFVEDHVFGYGPGGRGAVGLRWRVAESVSLGFSADYHLAKMFYADDLVLPPPPGAVPPNDHPIPLRPEDLLHGLTVSAGVVLDL